MNTNPYLLKIRSFKKNFFRFFTSIFFNKQSLCNYISFKTSSFALFFFLTTISIYSQTRFQNITLKNGLCSNRVYDCIKDSKGFIWFVTDNGICRYNGTDFSIFNKKNYSLRGLTENSFVRILERSSDEILLLSYLGNLFSYKYTSGTFTNLSSSIRAIKNQSISCLMFDKEKGIWFGTAEGLIHVDKDFKLYGEYKIKDFVKGQLISNRVVSMCEDSNGVLWLGMLSRTVVRFHQKTKQFSNKELANKLPPIQQVGSIIQVPNSSYVLIATAGDGLYKIDINNLDVSRWRFTEGQTNSLPSDRISMLIAQNDSIIWVGTPEGLANINLRQNKITTFLNNPNNSYSLTNNVITNLYIDNDRIIWISTFGGVSKLNTYQDRFDKISQVIESKNSISSNKVSSCTVDKFGNFWIATSKGIDIRDVNNKRYYHYNLPKSFPNHKNEEVIKFFIDGDTWWIGTWGGGLSRFILPDNFKPGNKLSFTNFYYDTLNTKSLSSNFIRSIIKDNFGNLWISTWNGGLNKINSEDKLKMQIDFQRFQNEGKNKNEVASNFLSEMIFDENNNLWISTSIGLQFINFRKNIFELLAHHPEDRNYKINYPISVFQDSKKNIWVSTFGGLLKVNKNEKTFETIYANDDGGVISIIEDKSGIIWFSTFDSKIGSYNATSKEIKFYSMINEIDGFEFYFGTPCIDRKENIYFTGNSGVIYFNPSQLTINRTPPPVYLTSIRVNENELNTSCDISQLKEISLSHDQNNLVISFAALNYNNSEANRYKYLLEGSGNEWVNLGNGNKITFANLPYGKYKLKIIGSNNDGVWNYSGTQLVIFINPPFWQNFYFRIPLYIIIIAGLYSFINAKIKRLKKEKQQQNNLSKLLIDSQEEERKRLSHELHDGLGQNLLVIKNQLALYKISENKDYNELLKIADLVKESIDEVKEISSNLHPHQLARLGFNKAIQAMVNRINKSTNIEIETKLDDVSAVLPKETEINLYRIIQESLNNIVKHSQSPKAVVEINKNDKFITVKIEDFGKGFDSSNLYLGVEFTEGLGLKSIKERVRLLGAELKIESIIGVGTKIFITLTTTK